MCDPLEVATDRLRTAALAFTQWASARGFAVGRVTLPMSCVNSVFLSPSLPLLFPPPCLFLLSRFGSFFPPPLLPE